MCVRGRGPWGRVGRGEMCLCQRFSCCEFVSFSAGVARFPRDGSGGVHLREVIESSVCPSNCITSVTCPTLVRDETHHVYRAKHARHTSALSAPLAGWEPHNMRYLGHVSWVGSAYARQILHNIS